MTHSISIQEAKKLKATTELQIAELLREFSRLTGAEVDSVRIEKLTYHYLGASSDYLVSIEARL